MPSKNEVHIGRLKEKNTRYWIIFLSVVSTLAIGGCLASYFLPLQKSFSSNSIEITGVRKEVKYVGANADRYIEGKWQEICYYDLRFYIGIENSKATDATNLRLVVGLNNTGCSGSRTIKMLEAGAFIEVLVVVYGVPHIYIYGDLVESKDISNIITLFSANQILDQKTLI